MTSKEHFNVNEYVKSVSSLTKYQILYNPTWTKVSKEYTYCDIYRDIFFKSMTTTF